MAVTGCSSGGDGGDGVENGVGANVSENEVIHQDEIPQEGNPPEGLPQEGIPQDGLEEVDSWQEAWPILSDDNHTQVEKRNLDRVDEWAEAWSLPGGSIDKTVNEIYAEPSEIFLPLQERYIVQA